MADTPGRHRLLRPVVLGLPSARVPHAAIAVGESGILFAGQTEVADAGKVNATWVFEKRDGQWLIAAYHNSPVHAPTP